jgi:L-ribulose-5-phosphate 4-epimerase
MRLETLRAELVYYMRKLAASGLVRHTQGNISARDSETGLICVTPSGMEYDAIGASDIVVVDEHGAVVEGRWKPTVETPTHTRVYRERADISAVIHAHATHATAFGIAYQPIPLVLMEAACCLGAPVPVAPYMMSGTEQFAELVTRTMGKGYAVVWGNHGILVAGPTLKQALSIAHAVEDNAQAYLLARQLGEPQLLPEDEVARLHQFWLNDYGQQALPEKNPVRARSRKRA